jgi:ABC-type transporter Mla subunit MlaD
MPGRLLFALLLVVTTAGACRRHHERIVFTDLPAAPGVREGGAVLFRGIDIGTIQRVTLMHSGVRLTLRIRRPDAPLRVGDRVALRTLGILGDNVVDIVPASGPAPPLPDSAVRPAMPPDSLAPAREAAARAIVDAMIGRAFRRDSTTTRP